MIKIQKTVKKRMVLEGDQAELNDYEEIINARKIAKNDCKTIKIMVILKRIVIR